MNLEPPPLGVVALVAHARSVASESRELFADAAAALADDPRAILLRTCHRAELYLVPDDRSACPRALELPELPAGGRRLTDREAVRHLFSVAAGLDSVVVGEDQILHQLRDCLSDRHIPSASRCPVEIGTSDTDAIGLDPVLARLFQSAAHLGRETRSWREGPPRSLADVVLDHIVGVMGPVAGRSLPMPGSILGQAHGAPLGASNNVMPRRNSAERVFFRRRSICSAAGGREGLPILPAEAPWTKGGLQPTYGQRSVENRAVLTH